MALKKGLYESVINKSLNSSLAEKRAELIVEKEKIDQVHGSQVFASYLTSVLKLGLSHYESDPKVLERQIELVNNLITYLADNVEDQELYEFLVHEANLLRSIYAHNEQGSKGYQVPLTSVAYTSLFTGAKSEPQLYSELVKEINSADRIDLLISFIRFSGLRLLLPALKEHTNSGKPLRVITTSYMGATDYKAIETLAKLSNTQIRISYDTKRTRLHAKAYYFHRDTGFSTAYIGSANMSRAALTDGLEWNLKISEHTSYLVLEKYRATFETYWNSKDFEIYDSTQELHRKRLRKSLTYTQDNLQTETFFHIRPYGYQQQILDQLDVEREVHNSRRNLVVAATGERVIIVMGAVCAIKSRVSGTLNKYISCIA